MTYKDYRVKLENNEVDVVTSIKSDKKLNLFRFLLGEYPKRYNSIEEFKENLDLLLEYLETLDLEQDVLCFDLDIGRICIIFNFQD